jgi:hypothetical protein
MSWKDLNNDLSDPSFSRMIFPNAPDSIITKFMKKGIYNFFPFKIVNLQWLVDIKKATLAPPGTGYQITNCGTYHFYAMTFDQTDNYLPVGDVIINREPWPNNGGWCSKEQNSIVPLDKVFVLLVKNNDKYSNIISNSAWKFVSRSRGCGGTGIYWAFRSAGNEKRQYNTEYNVIGDSFKTGDGEGWWWNDGNNIKSIFGEKARPIAAVNKNYLSVNDSKQKGDANLQFFQIFGDYSCKYRHFLSATSSFNTFNVSADEDTSGQQRDVYTSTWPMFKFYDIIPEFMISQCCSGNLPEDTDLYYCGRYQDENSATCKSTMKLYCKGDKLKEDSCKHYCKKNDCDTNLESFCSAGTYEEQKTKYNNNKEICSCFMPRDFYQQFDDEQYSKMGASGKKLVELLKASGVYGGYPECSNLQCKFGGTTLQHSTFKPGSCPNINIQNCINEQATTNKGTLKAGTIDQSQANNCVQSSQTTNNQAQPVSQPTPVAQPTPVSQPKPVSQPPVSQPTPQKSNLMLYLAIGGITLLIFLIILIVVLMK